MSVTLAPRARIAVEGGVAPGVSMKVILAPDGEVT